MQEPAQMEAGWPPSLAQASAVGSRAVCRATWSCQLRGVPPSRQSCYAARVTQPSTALLVQGSQADEARAAGCALLSAPPWSFTQRQPCRAMLRCTMSLMTSPARQARRLWPETNSAPMPHFVSELITAVLLGWGSFSFY